MTGHLLRKGGGPPEFRPPPSRVGAFLGVRVTPPDVVFVEVRPLLPHSHLRRVFVAEVRFRRVLAAQTCGAVRCRPLA